MKKGIFVNTEKANCSIYESGKMVHDCISQSDLYALDYIELNEIDIEKTRVSKKITLKSTGSKNTSSAFINDLTLKADFWVFNYHPYTMAPHFPQDLLACAEGLKFTIVLEVEPNNPLKFVPSGCFNSSIVLDPTAVRTNGVHPFPRPLNGTPRTGVYHNREIPIIGSFGLGTPGKGFEHVIEAVNQEFDRALVRINIPKAEHADPHTFPIHNKNYSLHISNICKKIAKPGIDVEFTHEFFDDRSLLDWCSENDLNFFHYCRRQSGLSATTDQCILSGQPLLVSSNDTFRHIHPYIPPYPIYSLKKAMNETIDIVSKIQKEWSKESFYNTFAAMLSDFDLFDDNLGKNIRKIKEKRKNYTVLFMSSPDNKRKKVFGGNNIASSDQTQFEALPRPDNILCHTKRYADSIGRTGEYSTITVNSENIDEIDRSILWIKPEIVIFDDINIYRVFKEKSNVDCDLNVFCIHSEAENTTGPTDALIPKRPIIPYYTSLPPVSVDRTRILVFGALGTGNQFHILMSKIGREMAHADVCFARLPDGSLRDVSNYENIMDDYSPYLHLFPAITASLKVIPCDIAEAINFMGTFNGIIFVNDIDNEPVLRDYIDLAMTLERPILFSKVCQFTGLTDGVFYEDEVLSDVLTHGISTHSVIYNKNSEGRNFAEFHEFFTDLKNKNKIRNFNRFYQNNQDFSGTIFPNPNNVFESYDNVWPTNDVMISPNIKEANIKQKKNLPDYAFIQQRFIIFSVLSATSWDSQKILLNIGDSERLSSTFLASLEYSIKTEIATVDENSIDCVFSSTALTDINDTRRKISQIIPLLREGGCAVFTYFTRPDYAVGDPNDNLDFPSMSQSELESLFLDMKLKTPLPPDWSVKRPHITPLPFNAPQLGTIHIVK